jgi:hypothetical protein
MNIQKLINWLLPSVLHKPFTQAWLTQLSQDFIRLNTLFSTFREGRQAALSTTPQVSVLRGALNRQFDSVLRRIEVVDLNNAAQTYMFTESENNTLYLPVFLQLGDGYDYVIRIPTALVSLKKQIEAFCRTHKLPSKRFRIDIV